MNIPRICTLDDDEIVVNDFCNNKIIGFSYDGMILYAKLREMNIYAFVRERRSDPMYSTFTEFSGGNNWDDVDYYPTPHPATTWEDYFDRHIKSRFSYYVQDQFIAPVDEFVLEVVRNLGKDAGRFSDDLRIYKRNPSDGNYYTQLKRKD